jgi:hypothetical protein
MANYCNLLALTGLDPDLNLIQGIVGIAGMLVLIAVAVRNSRRK